MTGKGRRAGGPGDRPGDEFAAYVAETLAPLGAQPFISRAKERTVTVGSYYAVPEDRLDEAETLLGWARRAVAAARANAMRTRRKRTASTRKRTWMIRKSLENPSHP